MIIPFLQRAVLQGIPLLFGSTGEIVTEKSGHLNLGIPGIMYVGAISGVIGAFFYEQKAGTEHIVPFLAIMIPLLCCLLGSLIMGLIYCFLTVTLRANQNVTGLALTTFGVGFGNFFGGSLIKLVKTDVPNVTLTATSNCFTAKLPFASKLGWFGDLFLSYSFLAYAAVVIAVAAAIVLKKTRVGLHLRAVGENPATADAAGINVNRYKYVATCVGSMIAGLGGLYYIMDYACGVWSNDGFGDRGWLAIALVIFAIWRPNLAIPGSFVFGGLYMIYMYIDEMLIAIISFTNKIGLHFLDNMNTTLSINQQELYKMAPYVVTILVLIITSMLQKRENQPPAHLGQNYFREER